MIVCMYYIRAFGLDLPAHVSLERCIHSYLIDAEEPVWNSRGPTVQIYHQTVSDIL